MYNEQLWALGTTGLTKKRARGDMIEVSQSLRGCHRGEMGSRALSKGWDQERLHSSREDVQWNEGGGRSFSKIAIPN